MNKYKVCIDSHQILDEKVHYLVTVYQGNQRKVSRKRYSDLKELHEKLVKKVHDFKLSVQLPLFPGRKFFGRTNDNLESIKLRSKELQDYLQEVLNLERLWQFDSIKCFLPEIEQESIIVIEPCGSEYSKNRCWSQMDELKRSYLERQERIQAARLQKNKNTRSMQTILTGTQRYSFSFEDYKDQKDTILYTVVLTDTKHGKNYRFKTRYSDLREYHLLLKKEWGETQLPKFPKRKLIGQTNDNPLEISERMEQLQVYFNQVFSRSELEKSEIMQFFITKIKLDQREEEGQRNSQPIAQGLQGSPGSEPPIGRNSF